MTDSGMASADASAFIGRIEAARRKGRRIQILMGLVIVGVFAFYSWQIYDIFANFNDQAFMRKLNQRAGTDVWPTVTAELDRVVSAATPVLAESFAKQLEADWPEIGKAIDDETAALSVKLREHPDKVVAAFTAALAAPVAAAIVRRFPDLDEAGRTRMVDRVKSRLEGWAQSRLAEGVEMHIQAMVDIKNTLESFKPRADGKPTDVSPDEFLVVLLEVIDVRLAGPAAAADDPQKGPAPKAPKASPAPKAPAAGDQP